MKEVVKIGGVEFTIIGEQSWVTKYASQKDLFDCYTRPSARKIGIWKSWVQWFDKYVDYEQIGVRSYNANFFTIDAIGYVPQLNDCYYFYITSTRHELIKLV